jgi:hypothetical protein
MRQEATRALYEGSLADVGDRNPYAGASQYRAAYEQRSALGCHRITGDGRRGNARFLTEGVTASTALQEHQRHPHAVTPTAARGARIDTAQTSALDQHGVARHTHR